MIINRIYPHVNVTTTALLRSTGEVVDSGATTLFVPFVAKKGPSNEVKKIFNLNQFISEYGEPDFSYQGRTILNAYNWLSSGGAVYALRLVGNGAKSIGSNSTINSILEIKAKYEGKYYDDLKLVLTRSIYTTSSSKFLDAEVLLNDRRIQTFFKLGASNFVTVLEGSQHFSGVSFKVDKDFEDLHEAVGTSSLTINFSGGSDGTTNYNELVRQFFNLYSAEVTTDGNPNTTTVNATVGVELAEDFTSEGLVVGAILKLYSEEDDTLEEGQTELPFIRVEVTEIEGSELTLKVLEKNGTITLTDLKLEEISKLPIMVDKDGKTPFVTLGYQLISNKLDNPIDLILDAGYPLVTKQAIAKFTRQATGDRSDIVVLFDQYDFSVETVTGTRTAVSTQSLNHAIYTQRLVVNDIISGRDIWVTPTYFLASLIPTNDRIYGIQWPTAGLTRGVLSGVKGIDYNPTEKDKDDLYRARINYVEKDSRGFYIMSQSTVNDEDTALRFLNNVRVINRMVRELETLGREYLFEFNDSATILNMRNVLNRYVTEWIQNRTLSLAVVDVQKNAQSEERVDVTMTIRFTGTIEIISIDITIEG
jgi:hypothetical protein